MTAPLGTTTCVRLGCSRKRHSVADGRVRYSYCLAHTLTLLSGAFGSGQGGTRAASPLRPSATLPGAAPATRPAA